jgi:hypothetical protein
LRFAIALAALAAGTLVAWAAEVPKPSAAGWRFPEAREVDLRGPLGEAYRKGVERLRLDPYRSASFLRADISFEMKRVFTNYSGDISGRFIEIATLTSPPGRMTPETLAELLKDLPKYQKADGHFGCDVDWSGPLEPESPNAVKLPIFWGNSRLLVGLVEAHRAFGRADLLQAARRIGDFYLATADRFLDPAREAEYRSTGTYAAGYPTDYFPGIEGLARLYEATRDQRYLRQAERMADFFQRFDKLPIDHSHGNLITHHGLLLLYGLTGKQEYLDRPLRRWEEAVAGGYVWPMGGVGEKFWVSHATDEGCSEADWLRLNLRLWAVTGQTRFLDMAERLLWNHYAMNRTDNGGYGHHNFVCDPNGPLLMQPKCTEAVWCCTFHGLLGLHTLKSHLIVGSPRGIFVNFPVDVSIPVETAQGKWKATVATSEDPLGEITCRVRLDPWAPGTKEPPEVFLRRPSWAESVTVRGHGREASEPLADAGYLRLPLGQGAEGEAWVTFSFAPRVEDRRMRRLSLDAHAIGRHAGVVLCHGPRLLMANAEQPRPVIAAVVDPKGRLVLPKARGGVYRLVRLDRADATEHQIAEAAKSGHRLDLVPWERARRDAPVVFVFDLIAIPETSPLAKLLND